MDADPGLALVARCEALPPEGVLQLFGELLAEDPHATAVPALALRNLARRGALDEGTIPVLIACLVDAPNLGVFVHLAKALAAFGRRATAASPYVVEKLKSINVTSDRRFWAFDSGLHALGYLGGPSALAYLEELATEEPPTVQKSKSVYKGELSNRERQEIFEETLDEVYARAEEKDPGEWREKATTRAPAVKKDAPKRTAPWMTR